MSREHWGPGAEVGNVSDGVHEVAAKLREPEHEADGTAWSQSAHTSFRIS